MAKNQNIKQKQYYNTINKDLKKYVSCLVVSDSVIPWTVTQQAPVSKEFSRQEYWSGLPFPPPGCLPNPELEPWSPALQADSLLSEPLKTLKNGPHQKKNLKKLQNTNHFPSFLFRIYVCIYVYVYKTAWFTPQRCKEG